MGLIRLLKQFLQGIGISVLVSYFLFADFVPIVCQQLRSNPYASEGRKCMKE